MKRISEQEFLEKNTLGGKQSAHVTKVYFDSAERVIVLHLQSGAKLSSPIRPFRSLLEANDQQLSTVHIVDDYHGLYWSDIGVRISADTFIRVATQMYDPKVAGAKGGRVSSEAKAKSSSANGALGGRPRKNNENTC